MRGHRAPLREQAPAASSAAQRTCAKGQRHCGGPALLLQQVAVGPARGRTARMQGAAAERWFWQGQAAGAASAKAARCRGCSHDGAGAALVAGNGPRAGGQHPDVLRVKGDARKDAAGRPGRGDCGCTARRARPPARRMHAPGGARQARAGHMHAGLRTSWGCPWRGSTARRRGRLEGGR